VLLRADLILTQTDTQRRLLQERFGRKGVILRNPIDLSQIPSGDEVGSEREEIALWIGKSDRIKRPEILLQLAAAFPDKQFVMVLNRSDPALFQAVVQNRPANVQILEWVSFQESERLFARAFVLVNTSSFEGFPNTFLQAGKYGVPLLSLQVDPEGFIERHTCGIVAQGSFDRLVNGFHLICSDQDRRSLFARNVQEYVQRHHALEEKIAQLHHLLSDLRGDG
jgi:glycosyltransferase involved in cell wall biosynthesis